MLGVPRGAAALTPQACPGWCSDSRTNSSAPLELQFFKMGIAVCFIEMRGSTIREAKSRSFELITPSKTFRYHWGRG